MKNHPEDFVVNESPLYAPCGEGEHLYLRVKKTNFPHDALIREIAKAFGVSQRAVGCAGRKDLYAVTSQFVSVHLPGMQPSIPYNIGSIEIVEHAWHTNKLRLGHLVGNSFEIKLRNIDSQMLQQIEQGMNWLVNNGLPNAFGPQRFGNNQNNHTLGLLLLLEDWEGITSMLLDGSDRHHAFIKELQYSKAFDAWPFGQPAERNVLEALAKGRTHKQACSTILKPLRKLWVNALQSEIFNEVLRSRVADGTWNTVVAGDLVWNHEGGGRTFEATEDDIHSIEFQARVDAISISPSGPLWGAKMRLPAGSVLEDETRVLQGFGLSEVHLDVVRKFASGARRPLCVSVCEQHIFQGTDIHGEYIQLNFTLPAGSYATVVVNRVLQENH